MKYICLGYIEPGKFEGMTETARHANARSVFCQRAFLQERPFSLLRTRGPCPGRTAKSRLRTALCRNQRTAWRHSSARGARPESCHSAHFAASGFEVWAVGSTTSCGFERTDEGKRTAAEKYRTMNAAPVWSKMSAQESGRKEHRCQKFV